jgi:hypothetical protein
LGWWWFGGREPTIRPVPRAPLTVRTFRVFRYGDAGDHAEPLGELGRETYRTQLGDEVEVEVELSEPAYAYLLACNPTDEVAKHIQLCLSADENTPPEERQLVSYKAAGTVFRLDDGAGLQAFVLLASRQRLPAYAEWRRQTPALTWKRVRATAGFVWRGDGQRLERLAAPGDLRGREVASAESALLDKLNHQLGSDRRIETAALIAFAVVR